MISHSIRFNKLAFSLFVFGCSHDKTITDPRNDTEDSATLSPMENPGFLHTEMVLNRSGRLFMTDAETGEEMWSLQNPDDPVWSDARIGLDQNTIWHNVVDVKNHDQSLSEFREIDRQGNILNRISVPGAHHSFDLLPNGDIIAIATLFVDNPEYGKIAGDSILKIAKDGQIETILSAFDVLHPQPLTDMWNHGQFTDAKDWTHANCIRFHAASSSILLTVPGVNALWRFNTEGEMLDVHLGAGMNATPYLDGSMYQNKPFDIYTGGVFDLPHGATQDDSGRLWVMSTGVGGQSKSHAEGYRPENGSLILERQIETREGAHSAGLGGVLYLPKDDSLLVNWGIFGRIEKVDVNAESHWQIEAPLQRVYAISTQIEDLEAFLND